MRFNLKKVLGVTAAVAVVATVAPFISTGVASAATSNGTAGITPVGGGNSDTAFQINIGAAPQCPGDSTNSNYRINSFIVPLGKDLTSLTFNGAGRPLQTTGPAGFYQNLFDTLGSPYANKLTALQVSPGGPGPIPLPLGSGNFNYAVFAPGDIPAGSYQIGIACAVTNAAQTFWSKNITVTTNVATGGTAQISWALGAPAAAPVLNTATPGNAQITAAFTPGTSDPAVPANGFVATATGLGTGPGIGCTTAAVTQAGSASPIVVPGLINGCDYSVTVSANNGVGAATVSNAVSPVRPTLPVAPAVTGLVAVNNSGSVTFNWNAYTAPGGATLSGFSVAITGGATTTLAAGVTTFTQAGAPGTPITATVTPLFSAPAGQTGAPASATGTPLSAAVINQVITVTRPAGQLVLTQVCGRAGSLPADSTNPALGAGGASLGFPAGIAAQGPLLDGDNPDPVLGTAPYLTQAGVPLTFPGANPDVPTSPAGPQDSAKFPQYPYPTDPTTGEAIPTYPTWCGIELGAAQFVRNGNPAYGQGQYYSVAGRLNQVTVVDTRDTDPGWTVSAALTDFTDGAKSFSANQMGWTPVKNRDTGLFVDALGNSYDQTTTAGPTVLAGIPLPANGLGNGPANTLISAAPKAGTTTATGGLGIAVADARLRLAIPVTALSGNYTAVLTISAI